MRTSIGLACLIVTAALRPSDARAQLAWEAKTRKIHLDADQDTLVVRFPFRNAGTLPVSIAPVRSCCGCSIAPMDRTVFQPGEAAEVVASLDLRKTRRKLIHVRTLAPIPAVDTLEIEVDAPSGVLFDPPLFYWSAQEPKRPKDVAARFPANASGCRVESAVCDAPGFTVSAAPAPDGGATIRLTPPAEPVANATCDVTVAISHPGGTWKRSIPVRLFIPPPAACDSGRP